MKPERNCTNCVCYQQAESDTAEAPDYGECRLLPPVVAVVNDEPMSLFPQVDADCFCAQWESKQ